MRKVGRFIGEWSGCKYESSQFGIQFHLSFSYNKILSWFPLTKKIIRNFASKNEELTREMYEEKLFYVKLTAAISKRIENLTSLIVFVFKIQNTKRNCLNQKMKLLAVAIIQEIKPLQRKL